MASYEVFVDARRGWVETGINVRPNEAFHVHYLSGFATISPGYIENVGPNGSPNYPEGSPGRAGPTCALPGHPEGCLAGRIDGGPSFFIGQGGRIIADRSGALSFAVNDDIQQACGEGYRDNTGGFKVRVEI